MEGRHNVSTKLWRGVVSVLAFATVVTVPLEVFHHTTRVLLPVKGNSIQGYTGRWTAYMNSETDLSTLHDLFPADDNYDAGDTLVTRAHANSDLMRSYAPTLPKFFDFIGVPHGAGLGVDEFLHGLGASLANAINTGSVAGQVAVVTEGLYRTLLRLVRIAPGGNLLLAFTNYIVKDVAGGFAIGFSPTLNVGVVQVLMRIANRRRRVA